MNAKHITYDFKNSSIEKTIDYILEGTIIFDTETSGLASYNEDPKDNKEIVELALVDSRDGSTIYHSLFKPEKPISGTLAIVNNIDNEKLKDAPLWKDEWPKIRNLMNGKTIVGFNNAAFDNNALDETCRRYGIDFNQECQFTTIDVMPVFMQFTNLFPLTYSRQMMIKQEVARNICGLTSIQTHRADDDCRDLLELIHEMKRRIIEKDPVSAEKFINEMPKKSMRKKYTSLLETEKKMQDMFSDLKKKKPVDEIVEKYKSLGNRSQIEKKIIRLAKKGIVDINDQINLSDKQKEEIYNFFQLNEDIGKTAETFGVSTLEVRNVVDSLIKPAPVEKKPTKCTIVEDLKPQETDVLDQYADLNDRLSQVTQKLDEYEKKLLALNEKSSISIRNETLADPFVKIEFKEGGKEKKTFDSVTFKAECPELYDEYLKRDDAGEYIKRKSADRVLYKSNREITADSEILQPFDKNFTQKIGDLVTARTRLKKKIDELKPAVKNIVSSCNCDRIDTKKGRFLYSAGKSNYVFDKDRFIAEHPETAESYMSSSITENSVSFKKTSKNYVNFRSLHIWLDRNESLSKSIFAQSEHEADTDISTADSGNKVQNKENEHLSIGI